MSEEGKIFRIRLDDQHLKEDIAVLFENLRIATETSKQGVREAINDMTIELDVKIKAAIVKAQRAVDNALRFSARSLRTITDAVQNYAILFGQQIELQFATQITGAISTIAYLEAQIAAAALSPATWAAIPLYAAVILTLLDFMAQSKLQGDRIREELDNNLREKFEVILERID